MTMQPPPDTGTLDLEGQLLGLCLRGEGLPDLPHLPAEVWAHPTHGHAWAVICRVHQRGLRCPTPVEVAGQIGAAATDEAARRECVRYLEGCVAAAPIVGPSMLPEAIDELAAAITGAYGKRKLHDVASILQGLALEPGTSAVDALDAVERDLAKLRVGEVAKPVTLRELALRLADDLERPSTVLWTVMPLLDSSLAGGLWTGKLYGIAARMKMGKTVMLGTLARAAAQRVPTLFIALEMGQAEIAQRAVAAALGCNSVHFLRRDDPDLPQRVVGYALRSDRPELSNLMFMDAPGCSFERLKAICQRAVMQDGVRLIVLDYWQLVRGQARGDTEAKHLGDVAQWMADFVRRHDVAGLTAAQINRQGETRGGDGLRMACDWYGHLHPTEVGNPACDRWLEALDSRYTLRVDVGSATSPGFWVDTVGPLMCEYA